MKQTKKPIDDALNKKLQEALEPINEKLDKVNEDIRKLDKAILERRYSIEITDEESNLEVIENICMTRKYLLKGGDYDYDRCCASIIFDFKQGKLGNITLDRLK